MRISVLERDHPGRIGALVGVAVFTLSTTKGFPCTNLGPNVRIAGSEIPKNRSVTGILP